MASSNATQKVTGVVVLVLSPGLERYGGLVQSQTRKCDKEEGDVRWCVPKELGHNPDIATDTQAGSLVNKSGVSQQQREKPVQPGIQGNATAST